MLLIGDPPTRSMAQGAGGILLPSAHCETVGLASPEEEAAPSLLCVLCFSLLPADGGRRGEKASFKANSPLLSKQTGENEVKKAPCFWKRRKELNTQVPLFSEYCKILT